MREILHSRGISFQRTRTWKESSDLDRDAQCREGARVRSERQQRWGRPKPKAA